MIGVLEINYYICMITQLYEKLILNPESVINFVHVRATGFELSSSFNSFCVFLLFLRYKYFIGNIFCFPPIFVIEDIFVLI